MANTTPDIHTIFNRALEHDSVEGVQQYLGEACAGDARIRERVEALLRAHGAAGKFLGGTAPSVATAEHLSSSSSLTGEQAFSPYQPGTRVGPYKIRELLAEGGMGMVYVAEQSQPVRRKVALKIVKPGMASQNVVARFEAERQALAMMDHPNIARVFDGGLTDSGEPFFVMELVRGIPISDYCDQQRLKTRERLQVFQDVCLVVQHAHQKGVIHRDLKPSNVLVSEIDGAAVPKVIDFGVAKAISHKLSEQTVYTEFSQFIGTPLYMSPEQAGMGVVDIDTRSDVYSLGGVLLYELLTGSTPFDRETLKSAAFDEWRRVIREDEPPRPSAAVSTLQAQQLSTVAQRRQSDPRTLSDSLKGELDWLVMKALEKDRNRRYQSASALAEDVGRYLADEPVEACPPSPWYLFSKYVRRHRGWLTAAAAITVLTLVGLAGTTSQAIRATSNQRRYQVEAERANEQAQRANDEAAKQVEARQREQTARNEAEQQRDLAAKSLYLAHVRLATGDLKSGQTVRLFNALESHVPGSGRPDTRGWEWYYLLSGCYDNVAALREARGIWSVDWSPEGRWISFAGRTGVVLWEPLQSGRRIELSGVSSSKVKWSPTGKRCAAIECASGAIRVWDVAANGNASLHLELWPPAARSLPRDLDWSPDGDVLAVVGHAPGMTDIWNVDKGKHLRTITIPNHGERYKCVAWHPQKNLFAVGSRDSSPHTVRIIEPNTGDVLTSKPSPRHEVYGLAWRPDGRQLAVSSYPDIVSLWSFDGERLDDVHLFTHPNCADGIAWNATGDLLATASRAQQVIVWDAKTGTKAHTFHGHLGAVLSVDWSPDGEHLVSGGPEDATVRVWDVQARCESIAVEDTGHEDMWIRWSLDGSRILYSVEKGWRMITPEGEVDRSIDFPNLNNVHHLLSPDARLAAIQHSIAGKGYQLIVVDARSGEKRFDDDARHDVWRQMAWCPQSKWLAVADMASKVEIWNTRTWERHDVSDLEGESTSVAFSPDGSQLAVGIEDAEDFEDVSIAIFSVEDWKQTGMLRGHRRWIGTIAWSPDGNKLAAGGFLGEARIWHVASRREICRLTGHTGGISSITWHPDGSRIATGSGDGTVRVWDGTSGDELLVFEEGGVYGVRVAWSPDGMKIASRSDTGLSIRDATAGYAAVRDHDFALDRATLFRNRAAQLASSDRGEEAEQLCRDAVKLCREALGDEHPTTLESEIDLAIANLNAEKQAAGQELLEETLRVQRRVLGNTHPRTLLTMRNLAITYGEQHKDIEEVKLRRELVEAARRRSDNDPQKITPFLDLLNVLGEQSDLIEAYDACSELLVICQKSDQLGSWLTLYSINQFFAACEAVDKHAEAKEVWQRIRAQAEWESAVADEPDGPNAQYRFRVDTPGEYQLYLRYGGHSGESDSVWSSVVDDGDRVLATYLFEGADAGPDMGDADADFATHSWETFGAQGRNSEGGLVLEQPALFEIAAAGEYILRVFGREGGVAVDAMVLQRSDLPPPKDNGPAESRRDESGTFLMQDGIVTIEAEHFSSKPPEWLVAPADGEGNVQHKNFRGSGYLLTPE